MAHPYGTVIIRGREFKIARDILELVKGKGPEHKQFCPICLDSEFSDSFFFREDSRTFHCEACKFEGNIYALVSKAKGVTEDRAKEIVIEAATPIKCEKQPLKNTNALGKKKKLPPGTKSK